MTAMCPVLSATSSSSLRESWLRRQSRLSASAQTVLPPTSDSRCSLRSCTGSTEHRLSGPNSTARRRSEPAGEKVAAADAVGPRGPRSSADERTLPVAAPSVAVGAGAADLDDGLAIGARSAKMSKQAPSPLLLQLATARA